MCVSVCVCVCVCVCVRGREYVWPASACTTAQVHVSGAARIEVQKTRSL